jgi:PAS domain S-box-containing protein
MEITKFRSQLFNAAEQVTVHLRLAQNTLTRLGRIVVDKPRRLLAALRAGKNHLRKLLASSLDAIVVTNVGRRFVAANPKALDLFGISETNLEKFTIDAFLSPAQSLYFTGHGPRFIRREKRHGKCRIRRIDGRLRIVKYIFVANFVPNRHLYIFRNVMIKV